MVRALLQHLRGNAIAALDGRIGVLDDLALHDERWAVAHLVVDIGRWGPGPRVLVSPQVAQPGRSSVDTVAVALTRDEVRASPAARLHLTQPRRTFWEGHARLDENVGQYTGVFGAHPLDDTDRAALRTLHELAGCAVLARDGAYGRVADVLVNEHDWTLPAVLIDTHRWYPRKRLSMPRGAIEEIDWAAREVHVRLTQAEIARIPAAA